MTHHAHAHIPPFDLFFSKLLYFFYVAPTLLWFAIGFFIFVLFALGKAIGGVCKNESSLFLGFIRMMGEALWRCAALGFIIFVILLTASLMYAQMRLSPKANDKLLITFGKEILLVEVLGMLAGIPFGIWSWWKVGRSFEPWLMKRLHTKTKFQGRKDGLTDIREIDNYLPNSQSTYDPSITLKMTMFF